jgi:hypothetical protein
LGLSVWWRGPWERRQRRCVSAFISAIAVKGKGRDAPRAQSLRRRQAWILDGKAKVFVLYVEPIADMIDRPLKAEGRCALKALTWMRRMTTRLLLCPIANFSWR